MYVVATFLDLSRSVFSLARIFASSGIVSSLTTLSSFGRTLNSNLVIDLTIEIFSDLWGFELQLFVWLVIVSSLLGMTHVSNKGHWTNGDYLVKIGLGYDDFDYLGSLVRQSYVKHSPES